MNPEPLSNELCMSLPKIAARFGVGRTTVWKAINDGSVPAFRVGHMYRVRPSTIPPEIIERWRNQPIRRWAGLPEGPLVYFLIGVPGYVKIGFTAALGERMKDLQVGCPVPLRLAAYIDGHVCLERDYHERFAEHRCEGEWFALAPEIQNEIDRINASGPCASPITHQGVEI